MEAFPSKILLFPLLIILFSSFSPKSAQASRRPYQEASTKFIRTSCSTTTYPKLCFSSLVKHATFIQTNRVLLTGTALNVTLASAKSTSALISNLTKTRGLTQREAAAMKDCVEVLRDSMDELRRSIGEMSHLRSQNFELTMNDVQTWVSAALTDEDTCTDGFAVSSVNGDDVKSTVRRQIVHVGQMTSNALALINQLASLHH